jgi:hypothetical protein
MRVWGSVWVSALAPATHPTGVGPAGRRLVAAHTAERLSASARQWFLGSWTEVWRRRARNRASRAAAAHRVSAWRFPHMAAAVWCD